MSDEEDVQVEEEDVVATDAARNLAEENNIDLTSVKGTGSEGRITVEDVREAIELLEEQEAAEAEAEDEEVVEEEEGTPVGEAPEGPGEPPFASQLPTIPIRDESGSDIPPTNLVQPPVELPPPPSEGTPVDPALEEPAEFKPKDEVEPELDEEGNEIEPEVIETPQEPDVVDVDPGTGEGEYLAPITVEDWVLLGHGDLIPFRVRGKYAAVLSAPRIMIPIGQEDKIWLTVRVRDETNAMITVPLSEVTLDRGGRGRAATSRA
jgi:hypothetical protein